jgi:hypothetical protein
LSRVSDDAVFGLGVNEPKTGSTMRIFWDFVSDSSPSNPTSKELVEEFIRKYKGKCLADESFAKGYLNGAVRGGHINVVEEL